MWRKLWIIIGILMIAMLIVVYGYVRKMYFFPHSDFPVTNHIGWWAYQDNLIITGVDCDVPEVRFGLFNTGEALIRLHIKGEVSTPHDKWKPYVEKIHISERFVTGENSPSANFNITPIIGAEENATYNNEAVPFEVKIEYVIRAYKWGDNKYIFQCGNITREITLLNPK